MEHPYRNHTRRAVVGKQLRREEPATLVASSAQTSTLSADNQEASERHRLERDVQRRLLEHPELCFSSLVVRRIGDGVCLEGVLEMDDCPDDVGKLVQRAAGVTHVLNHLVVRRPPQKG